jgi:GH15 family glucan-1,4-alpha-glucosidase
MDTTNWGVSHFHIYVRYVTSYFWPRLVLLFLLFFRKINGETTAGETWLNDKWNNNSIRTHWSFYVDTISSTNFTW